MRELVGPFPAAEWRKMLAANVQPPVVGSISGEITTNKTGVPIGVVRTSGHVVGVWMSLGASGKDDAHTLSLDTDVRVNGTSCLTTKPKIAHVSGEASQQKTTKVTGDTGVTQAVVNYSASEVSPGDVLTMNLTLVRTATPTTEIQNAVVMVEIEPTR